MIYSLQWHTSCLLNHRSDIPVQWYSFVIYFMRIFNEMNEIEKYDLISCFANAIFINKGL